MSQASHQLLDLLTRVCYHAHYAEFRVLEPGRKTRMVHHEIPNRSPF